MTDGKQPYCHDVEERIKSDLQEIKEEQREFRRLLMDILQKLAALRNQNLPCEIMATRMSALENSRSFWAGKASVIIPAIGFIASLVGVFLITFFTKR